MMAAKTGGASEARSSAIMAVGTLLSRVLGFLRQLMLVYALGLGSTVTDTFVNANNLPNLIFSVRLSLAACLLAVLAVLASLAWGLRWPVWAHPSSPVSRGV